MQTASAREDDSNRKDGIRQAMLAFRVPPRSMRGSWARSVFRIAKFSPSAWSSGGGRYNPIAMAAFQGDDISGRPGYAIGSLAVPSSARVPPRRSRLWVYPGLPLRQRSGSRWGYRLEPETGRQARIHLAGQATGVRWGADQHRQGDDKLPLSDPALQKAFLDESKRVNLKIESLCLEILHRNCLKSDPLGQRWVADSIPSRRLWAYAWCSFPSSERVR